MFKMSVILKREEVTRQIIHTKHLSEKNIYILDNVHTEKLPLKTCQRETCGFLDGPLSKKKPVCSAVILNPVDVAEADA